MLVPYQDDVQQFLFTGHEVCPVIGPDDGWNANAGDKPSMPIRQQLVSIEGTTWKWTARAAKQVKRNPNVFQLNISLKHRTGQSSQVQCW